MYKRQDLLRAIRDGDPAALADLAQYHPEPVAAAHAKLADAQLVLARSYEASSWSRLVLACRLTDAIWRDDPEAVRTLVVEHPYLLHEQALIRNSSNWGPPLSYAANLGRDRIITLLHGLGATDLQTAADRATLQSQIDTARMLHAMMGSPRPDAQSLGGPAYNLSTTVAVAIPCPIHIVCRP